MAQDEAAQRGTGRGGAGQGGAGGRVVGGGMAGDGRWMEVRDELLFFSIFFFFSVFLLTCRWVPVHLS
jgi:hypothetical protein